MAGRSVSLPSADTTRIRIFNGFFAARIVHDFDATGLVMAPPTARTSNVWAPTATFA